MLLLQNFLKLHKSLSEFNKSLTELPNYLFLPIACNAYLVQLGISFDC